MSSCVQGYSFDFISLDLQHVYFQHAANLANLWTSSSVCVHKNQQTFLQSQNYHYFYSKRNLVAWDTEMKMMIGSVLLLLTDFIDYVWTVVLLETIDMTTDP